MLASTLLGLLAACSSDGSAPTQAAAPKLQPSNKASFALVGGTTPLGFLQVCKIAGAPTGVTGSFDFAISGPGGAQTASVPVGTCTHIQVNSGNYTVTETGPANFTVSAITATSSVGGANLLVSSNLALKTAVVTVQAQTAAGEATIVNVTNVPVPPGTVKVCKIAGTGIALGTNFTFTVGGTAVTVPAGPAAQGGNCVILPNQYQSGTVLRVTETGPLAGTAVSSITVDPAARGGTPNLVDRYVDITTGAGETAVTFTNVVPVVGTLKVCKIAGTGISVGTNFTFTAGATAFTVPAGSAAQGGNCVILPGTYPAGTVVRVTETGPLAGTAVSSIVVDPANRGGPPNLAGRFIDVTIGAGETAVTFTNIVPATVRVCKIGGNAGAIGQTFSFTSNFSAPFTLVAAADPGNCTTPVAVAIGSTATATEAVRVGYIVFGNQYTLSTTIVAGLNTITFRNFRALRECRYTQGFYKNHGVNNPGNQQDAVTPTLAFGRLTGSPYVTSTGAIELVVGGSQFGATLTAQEIDDLYAVNPRGGNEDIILLHQLVTAQLNVIATGTAATPSGILADIARAQVLLVGGVTAAERAEALAIADRLDEYNNTSHCE